MDLPNLLHLDFLFPGAKDPTSRVLCRVRSQLRFPKGLTQLWIHGVHSILRADTLGKVAHMFSVHLWDCTSLGSNTLGEIHLRT